MDWKEYFETHPGRFGEREFMKQVGKTVHGEPITEEQKQAQIKSIRAALDLGPDDRVLDLCCGNGVLTREVAAGCVSVAGVDFSAALISIADKYNRPDNVEYHCMSATDPAVAALSGAPFDKVYMYEAFQHFDEDQARLVLQRMAEASTGEGLAFIAGIPDKERIWNFYNTPERRAEYHERVVKGTEAIGQWWEPGALAEVCASLGYSMEVRQQNPVLHSARYRFDAVLRKTGGK